MPITMRNLAVLIALDLMSLVSCDILTSTLPACVLWLLGASRLYRLGITESCCGAGTDVVEMSFKCSHTNCHGTLHSQTQACSWSSRGLTGTNYGWAAPYSRREFALQYDK